MSSSVQPPVMKAYWPAWRAETIIGGICQCVLYFLFYVQPGVNRRAVMEWILNIYPGEPIVGVLLGCVMVQMVLPALCLAFYYFLYHNEWPFFEQYRVSNWSRVGWNSPDPELRAGYIKLVKSGWVGWPGRVWSDFMMLATFFTYMRLTSDRMFFPALNEVLETVPDAWSGIRDLGIGCVFFETWFYWGHRFQHKFLYQYHKIHHEYVNPITLTGIYGHAWDGLITAIIPGVVPLLVLKFNLYTVWMWLLIHGLHTYVDHAGYQFPFNPFQLIPGSNHIAAHDFHHTANCCNYGLYWRFWDWAMGTDKEWVKFADKQAAAQAVLIAAKTE